MVACVSEGVVSREQAESLCIIIVVFIHWDAKEDKAIFDNNYQAVKEALTHALRSEPSVDTVLTETPAARHPFAGGTEG